ncbi:McrB family protein [Chryseobacterium tongliaoense]|uniref:McrB family protein n=1 Tax=Chryseobacterium tongliaoense TaxID=3240933 RepID=UPI003514E5C4
MANKFYKVDPVKINQFKLFKDYSYPTQDNLSPIESYITNTEKFKNAKMDNHINLLKYKKQIILQGPPGTGKTREAKLIAKEMLGLPSVADLQDHPQFNLVQFHPSYTYEDFVRGIVAKPNEEGEGIIYGAENKTLGKFAEEARKNFLGHHGKTKNNINFQNKLNILLDKINENIVSGLVYPFGEKITAQIVAIKEDGFIYNFPDREEIKYKILFSDMEKIYNNWNEISKPIDLRDQEIRLGLTMRGKYPYYYRILQQLIATNANKNNPVIKEDLKNYVLVIDEINRANVSSVLGELIYALEYRNEVVESMYEVDGSKELILPPNLYIIGTMNTADRSVGHIDYAVRRRFAFVTLPPRNLKAEDGMQNFDESLYHQVNKLFEENCSSEFEKEHIRLGHSYFIDQSAEGNGAGMAIRLEYEIKPILYEYVNDGMLIGEDIKEKIAGLQASL